MSPETSASGLTIGVDDDQVRFMMQPSQIEKAKIAVLWTGGTMGSTTKFVDGREVAAPGMTGKEFEAKFLSKSPSFLAKHDITWIPLFPNKPRGVDSTEMTNEIMRTIGERIHEIISNPEFAQHMMIVTHGTDTLGPVAAQTAFALQGIDRHIVFCGAQIHPGDLQSDAIPNFGLAVKTAAMRPEKGRGQVLVAFDDIVIRGVAATKQEGVNKKHTFVAQHQSPVALLKGADNLEVNTDMLKMPPSISRTRRKYYSGIDGEVMIVKFTPNLADEGRMRRLLDYSNSDAIILEGYAAGNIPLSIKHVIEEVSEKMLVIITPSTATHGASEALYQGSAEVGHPTALHFVGPSHTALAKFQWLFAQGKNLGLKNFEKDKQLNRWVKDRFLLNYIGEITKENNPEGIPPDLFLHTPHLIETYRKKFAADPMLKKIMLHLNPEKEELPAAAEIRIKWLKESIIRYKVSMIITEIRNAWLAKQADMHIAEGNLKEEDKQRWISLRDSIQIPVEWLTGNGPFEDNIIWKFYQSPHLISSDCVPVRLDDGTYEISQSMLQTIDNSIKDSCIVTL